jgi:valyl-tRNA synthetase
VEKDRARVAELESRISKQGENLRRIAPVEVKIAPPAAGNVNLEEELKEELAGVSVPAAPDNQVREALDKLREGTKEGLTSRDRYDLGVAYMNMGLVDDAVREFNQAKEGGAAEAAAAAKAQGADAKATKPAAPKKAAPAKKKPAPAARKAPAKKKPAAKKAATKKKPAAKKAPPKKKPAAKKKR